ncbi:MAG TPA: DUF494 family protein [bacterium]|nr:DUF494 family protein [bacterium]HPR89682.1 DUF494 family protein [bacterium]
MNKRLLEIIAYAMKEIKNNSFENIDLQFIMDVLLERGFSEEEISGAMSWLVNHGETIDRIIKKQRDDVPRPVWRHLNETERQAISPEAYGYLFHLREMELLDDDAMETIIERAVNIKLPSLDIEDMQDLIAIVVLDFENSASEGYFQYTANHLPN